MTRLQLIIAFSVTAFYFVGQLATGTDAAVAALFSAAILLGMFAMFAGGGLRCAVGCLNGILIGKFLMFGVALKILMWQPADATLGAPKTTAAVMAIGFASLLLGTLVQSRVIAPQLWSINRPLSDRMLLSFAIVLFMLSYIGYFASQASGFNSGDVQTGGFLGIARNIGTLKSFAIIPPMLYLWRKNTRLWMTHPVILAILMWSCLVGIFSTGKQDAIEPLVFYMFVGFLRYGWRDSRIWGFCALALLYYAVVIFPYSQYVRFAGGREGTLESRLEATENTFLRIAQNSDFRDTVESHVSNQRSYFDKESLAPFARLAMVGEADRLIAATQRQNMFTGWETITWGFKLLTPSFLYHDKPIYEAGNYLGHIGGDVSPGDTTTQISYGVMANLYNAFALPGVFLGTTIFFGLFYYVLRLFIGAPQTEGAPTASTLWYIWMLAAYQHTIVESSLAGMIASFTIVFVIAGLFYLAKVFSVLLPVETAAA